MTVARLTFRHDLYFLYLEGPLRAPIDGELRRTVGELLRRGSRGIVLDLARVSRIDAAGVGALVGAYNMAITSNRVLRIVHATPWVRETLQRAGLFDLLSAARGRAKNHSGERPSVPDRPTAEFVPAPRGRARSASNGNFTAESTEFSRPRSRTGGNLTV
jgi:anti-anti-sigma factor